MQYSEDYAALLKTPCIAAGRLGVRVCAGATGHARSSPEQSLPRALRE